MLLEEKSLIINKVPKLYAYCKRVQKGNQTSIEHLTADDFIKGLNMDYIHRMIMYASVMSGRRIIDKATLIELMKQDFNQLKEMQKSSVIMDTEFITYCLNNGIIDIKVNINL